jgi:hypothetical protein
MTSWYPLLNPHMIMTFNNLAFCQQIVKETYESMLVVRLFQPPSDEFKKFEARVKETSMELYNYSYDANKHDVSIRSASVVCQK